MRFFLSYWRFILGINYHSPFKTNGIFHKFATVKSEWSIKHIKGSQFMILPKYRTFFSGEDFVLANSLD